MAEQPLVNRVAASGLITFNLEDLFPAKEIMVFDLKDYLFMELILKEKDFRAALKEHDWTQYTDKHLTVTCSTDAIIPVWAYMLVSVYAEAHALSVSKGNQETFIEQHYHDVLAGINPEDYQDKRVVIKGCSQKPVPISAYLELTNKLRPVVKSLMYGEPCSTVPLYKQPRKK